jgi:hypothetical protein
LVPAALALGYFATCAVIGISGLVLFGDAEGAVSTVGRVISITVGGLLIASSLGPEGSIVALGLVLLVFAIPVVVLIGLLYDRAATCVDGAGVIADVDGEAQPGDHSRDLLRVRSVLPRKRPVCGVRAWATTKAVRRATGGGR